ncbi:hypothetical protein ACP4OV_023361 [Aristida adscensionis]
MASAAAALLLAAAAAAVLLLASPATAAGDGCAGEKFPAGRSYAHCAALGQLGAALHWTFDAKSASLSLAFVAKPAGAGGAGWVAWALNPTGDEMKGAQALLALKGGGGGGAYVVNTYNITGYGPLPATSTPIAFKATDLAADESADRVRLYGKLQLRPGMGDAVNTIWQVGSAVTNGAPAKHAFAKENLSAKARISLSGAPLAPAPAPAAAAGVSSSAQAGRGGAAATPAGGKSAAAAASVPAPMLMLLALAGFLAIVG